MQLKIFLGLVLFPFILSAQGNLNDNLTDEQIINRIVLHRPLKGARIDPQIKQKIGATHVAGKYYFSKDPYLIEGAKKLDSLGYGVIKLWFRKNGGGYPYNSEWNIPGKISLKELAMHPYWKETFDLPFTTFALSLEGAGVNTTDSSSKIEEEEIYELSKYLLQKYKNRKITFILHNWEGDWVMRGGTGSSARWSRKPGELIRAVDGDRVTVTVPADSSKRINAMVKWFAARQRGVERARKEIKNSKATVFHAIEANKVMDSREGIPGIANSVLPLVETDMVSWSCYDGLDSTGLNLYKGIEYLKKNMRPTAFMKNKRVVFLGEIGIPEQRYEGLTTYEPVVNRWDAYIGVCEALNVPYLIQWELYCNEPKNEELRKLNDVRKTDEMRGFWLIRPDGTLGFAAKYFDALLKNSGKKLNPAIAGKPQESDALKYWNAHTQLLPWRPNPLLANHAWHDLDKDGDPDILTATLNGGFPICWIDDDDDMKWNDKEGDTDSDCLLIDKNKDGIFAGPFDLSLDWSDEDKDGKADIQLIVNNGGQNKKNIYDWDADYMYILDEDKDQVHHYIDWNKIMMQAWEHDGHSNFYEDYKGNSTFLKMHASSFSIRDVRFNWENPFIFYDHDNDGRTEWAIRLVDSPVHAEGDSTMVNFTGRINYAALTWDLDDDNSAGNEFDFDLSMLVKGKGFDYSDQVHAYSALSGIPGENKLFFDHRWREIKELIYPDRDSAWDLIFRKGEWNEYRLIMDEDDDCNRWERVEFYDPKDLFLSGRGKGGLDDNGQADVAGDRGEFDMDGSGKGKWYVGAFDQRIHLSGAEWGAWRIDQTAFYYQGFGGLYDRWKPGRLQDHADKFATVQYKDSDGNGFIDKIFYDLNGDRQMEDSISFHALGISDKQPLIDPSTLSYEDIKQLYKNISEKSWQNAQDILNVAKKYHVETNWYSFYKNPSSIQEKYSFGYWLQFYIYRDLRDMALQEGNKEFKNELDKAYYTGNWKLVRGPVRSNELSPLLQLNAPKNTSSRLFFNDQDIKRVKRFLKENDPFITEAFNELKVQADKILSEPLLNYKLDAAGLRIPSIHQFAVQAPSLVMMYRLTGNKIYAERIWKQTEILCDYPDWGADRHFLDAGIAGFTVALIQDGLKGYLSKSGENKLYQATTKKLLNPAKRLMDKNAWWHHANNNWNGISNGGIIVASLCYYEKDPEKFAGLATKAINALPYYIESFEPDGQSEEGLMYWSYGLMYTTQALEALQRMTGTSFGLDQYPGFKKTGWFPFKSSGPVTSLSVGDDPVKSGRMQSFGWLIKNYKDSTLGKLHAQLALINKNIYWPDMIYYERSWLKTIGAANLSLHAVIRGIDLYNIRQNWNPSSLFISMHGGSNSANHGHLDAGSFDIQGMGEVWAYGNLGRDLYTLPGYFSKRTEPGYNDENKIPDTVGRWHFYRLRAEGKNTVVFNPGYLPDQNPDGQAKLIQVKHDNEYKTAYTIDLKDCYSRDVNSYNRTIGMDRMNNIIWITDSIRAKSLSDIYWSMHTKAEIDIKENGKLAVLNQNGKFLYARIISPVDAKFDQSNAEYLNNRKFSLMKNSSNPGYRKLLIKLSEKTTNISVVFSFENPSESFLYSSNAE